MCQFLSAIMTRTGEIYCEPLVDSHETLIKHFKLKEGKAATNFIRVEFTPKDAKFDEPDQYGLCVDEPETPAWFDDEKRECLTKYLRGQIERMIVTDRRQCLIGGAWILGDGAEIGEMHQCRVIWAHKNATIENAWSATIKNAGYATIRDAAYATIENAGYATIENAGYATIRDIQQAKVTR